MTNYKLYISRTNNVILLVHNNGNGMVLFHTKGLNRISRDSISVINIWDHWNELSFDEVKESTKINTTNDLKVYREFDSNFIKIEIMGEDHYVGEYGISKVLLRNGKVFNWTSINKLLFNV